jgi:7-cyano-7-deazaguanine synthase in queuosine biosynthesis
VKTRVVRSGGLDSVTFAYKVAVDQTVINLATFDFAAKRD